MKYKRLLAITIIIVITAFFAGCAEQGAVNDNGDDQNALLDDEVTESVDEEEVNDNNDETEALEDNDVPEAVEISSDAHPFQAFNQARENGIPIVLKFYSDT